MQILTMAHGLRLALTAETEEDAELAISVSIQCMVAAYFWALRPDLSKEQLAATYNRILTNPQRLEDVWGVPDDLFDDSEPEEVEES